MTTLKLEDFGFALEQSAEDFHAEREAAMAALTPVGAAYSTAQAFAEALNALDGEEEQAEVLAHMVGRHLSRTARAQLVFQSLTARAHDDRLTVEDKIFAVELAETMGPDWCQWLYKFAVICTKVA